MVDFVFLNYKFIRVAVESFVKLNYICLSTYSSVAQLVEQLTVNQLVAGSSPARGAKKLTGLFQHSRIFQYLQDLFFFLF